MKALLLAGQIKGFKIETTDGIKGKAQEFLFDDTTWNVRHLVVAVNGWWNGKKVLLSPYSLKQPDWRARKIPSTESSEEIEKSPDVTADLPVARVADINLIGSVGTNFYIPEAFIGRESVPEKPIKSDPHLRSTAILNGVLVKSHDGTNLGIVHDFILDSIHWRIPYMLLHHHEGGMMLLETSEVQSIDVSIREMELKDSINTISDYLVDYDPRYTVVIDQENREMQEEAKQSAH
jgi:hypothetical protein